MNQKHNTIRTRTTGNKTRFTTSINTPTDTPSQTTIKTQICHHRIRIAAEAPQRFNPNNTKTNAAPSPLSTEKTEHNHREYNTTTTTLPTVVKTSKDSTTTAYAEFHVLSGLL
jgi:hypothetical protein